MIYHNNAGYTLIELIVIISIISFLSFVTVIKIPSLSSAKVNITKDYIVMDIRLVQNLSLSQQTIYGIKVDAAQENYTVYKGNNNFDNIITNPSTSTTFSVNIEDLFPGITMISTDLAGNTLQFDKKGIPADTSGAINTTKNIVLSNSSTGETATISITPYTGLIQ
ncbi:MAG: hypothetical protein DKM50_01350 [Candidatus Margulisiibacteriota bacterium]|nr:MAG: hypothetical protein A2X43_08465 [Candidatus Margulisbacteria bacterium GWD2_39_127]OGI05082.1 MAG: hypothetical protein A2X42_12480 [Candidatus Margulisbacteria bacterium GWF2_38_17]OGI09216.1 MAG: hypothetical protein A2X41_01410 [Candidatus Margulisbacteria bacterium GWE2_39_32]PZM83748.1 MAG: hypothetical protein DKM50_01350 [Candidatus Margulisiibacteriota bacterium]HAR63060.1 hypothetical protein [Candidatus Margulisiibacteriota bacterium]